MAGGAGRVSPTRNHTRLEALISVLATVVTRRMNSPASIGTTVTVLTSRSPGYWQSLLGIISRTARPSDPYCELEFDLHAPALITLQIWIGNSQDGLNAAMDVL